MFDQHLPAGSLDWRHERIKHTGAEWAIPLDGLTWRQARIANRINEILVHQIDSVTRDFLDEAFVAYCAGEFTESLECFRLALRDHLIVACEIDDVQLGTITAPASEETERAIDANEQARRLDSVLAIATSNAEDVRTGRV